MTKLLIQIAAFATTLAMGVWAVPALSPSPTPMNAAKLSPDPNAVYVGLYNIGDVAVTYGEMKAKSDGQPVGITLAFHDWNAAGIEADAPELQTFADPMESGDVSPLWMARRVAQDGGILAIVWDAVGYLSEHRDYFNQRVDAPITFDDIFSGVYDDYIRDVAAEVRSLEVPVMISPVAEFNSVGFFRFGPNENRPVSDLRPGSRSRHYGDPTIPDGPERVRDLYRHVIDIFRAEGVNNVTWFMYSHSSYMNPDALELEELDSLDDLHPRHYYPGDDYIDWIGNSAYISMDDPTQDLEYAIGSALDAFAEVTDKPVLLAEFGIVTENRNSRAGRMRKLFSEEIPAFPQVRAFAFAEGDLFSLVFAIPRLGHQSQEIKWWRSEVVNSDAYTSTLRFE